MDDLIIDGDAVDISDQIEPKESPSEVPSDWAGDCPFFLVIEFDEKPESGHLGIDLDFAGWSSANAESLRQPGTWWLFSKETQTPVMGVVIEPGDQGYFTKHHVGNLMTAKELMAYGLGKKRSDGTMVRNWLLPNGVICGGDDVDLIGARMLGG